MPLKSICNHREKILVWEPLAADQTDPWQVVPRQVFTLYSCLLISTAFVVVSRVGCDRVTGVLNLDLLSLGLALEQNSFHPYSHIILFF